MSTRTQKNEVLEVATQLVALGLDDKAAHNLARSATQLLWISLPWIRMHARSGTVDIAAMVQDLVANPQAYSCTQIVDDFWLPPKHLSDEVRSLDDLISIIQEASRLLQRSKVLDAKRKAIIGEHLASCQQELERRAFTNCQARA